MKEIYVRLERCLGCMSCQIACAVAHSQSKTLFGAILERPAPRYRVHVAAGDGVNVPLQCRHCDDAPCVHACMAGAMRRGDAGVLVDEKKCVGCWMCVMVCPFGVITPTPEKVAVKCDMCADEPPPRCVPACPTGALVYEEGPGVVKERRRAVARTIGGVWPGQIEARLLDLKTK